MGTHGQKPTIRVNCTLHGRLKQNWGILGRTKELCWEDTFIYSEPGTKSYQKNYFVCSKFPFSVRFLACHFSWITQHEHKNFCVPVKF